MATTKLDEEAAMSPPGTLLWVRTAGLDCGVWEESEMCPARAADPASSIFANLPRGGATSARIVTVLVEETGELIDIPVLEAPFRLRMRDDGGGASVSAGGGASVSATGGPSTATGDDDYTLGPRGGRSTLTPLAASAEGSLLTTRTGSSRPMAGDLDLQKAAALPGPASYDVAAGEAPEPGGRFVTSDERSWLDQTEQLAAETPAANAYAPRGPALEGNVRFGTASGSWTDEFERRGARTPGPDYDLRSDVGGGSVSIGSRKPMDWAAAGGSSPGPKYVERRRAAACCCCCSCSCCCCCSCCCSYRSCYDRRLTPPLLPGTRCRRPPRRGTP
jgi:hypothetical protein